MRFSDARSARDRDRLRQAVLENLGWRFHRIWSTDWYRHPDQELDRVINAIEKAKLFAVHSVKQQIEKPSCIEAFEIVRSGESAQEGATSASSKVHPYKKALLRVNTQGIQLGDVDPAQLVDAVKAVVDAESPVHQDDLLRRITEAAGLSRAGNKIQGVISKATQIALRQGLIKKRREFLWQPDMSETSVRNRIELSQQEKKIDRISPEEITSALILQVESNFSMSQDEAISEAGRCLGFQRVTAQSKQVIEKQLKILVINGTFEQVGEMLQVSQAN
jgi:hypothetical protein